MDRHWWTWLGYAVTFSMIAAGHIAWFFAAHEPEIGARFGAAVTCLGIIVTARPFFRTGLQETVDRQLPAGLHDAVRPSPHTPTSEYTSRQHLQRKQATHKRLRPGVVHDVIAERVVGVVLILLGTLTHGYGDLALKWMVEP
jgi:hypothetical protein